MKRSMISALAAMLVLGLAASALAKDMFEEEVDNEALAVKLARDTQAGGYALITAPELKAWMDQGKTMLLVDTMPFEASYKKEHAPKAVSFEFPIEAMDTWDTAKTGGKSVQDFEKLLGPDKQRLIVFYCGFVKCTRSHNAALWAKKLGYTNLVRFPGGVYAWKGSKFPVEAEK
jgi:thiosulfate/3-mercaptopyruvate sulfurtransferase